MKLRNELKFDKRARQSLITYAMVIIAFVVVQILLATGSMTSLMKGLLVPLWPVELRWAMITGCTVKILS